MGIHVKEKQATQHMFKTSQFHLQLGVHVIQKNKLSQKYIKTHIRNCAKISCTLSKIYSEICTKFGTRGRHLTTMRR